MRWLDHLRGLWRNVQAGTPAGRTGTPDAGKIPTTPLMLAASLSYMTSANLAGILKAIDEAGGQRPTTGAIADGFRELLCALYCLAVVVLGEDESGHEMGSGAGSLFNLYTATVFEELERSDSTMWPDNRGWDSLGLRPAVLLDPRFLGPALDEATGLYLNDRPDLRTLAASAPEYCARATQVESALRRNNWTLTFMAKAWIRFAKVMDLRGNDLDPFVCAYISFSRRLLSCIDAFKKMRPAFVAE